MQQRPVRPAVDAPALVDLVIQSRATAGHHAFPSPDDVWSMLAHPDGSGGAVWVAQSRIVAWAHVQPELGNLLFEVAPAARAERVPGAVVAWGVERLRAGGADSVDTPVESDDPWRSALLAGSGFTVAAEVVHLRRELGPRQADATPPPGLRIRPLGGDVDSYVAAHRAAFGTSYLTAGARRAWERDAGYDPDHDLVLVDEDDRIVGFSVSYLVGEDAEIGTVGVVPEHRGQGLSQVMVAHALRRLATAGARTAAMSTAAENGPMLATARACGFTEVRRTGWWHRPLR